ncbi:MAG TPA: topoisomerase C-terminal repeat-containing protein, partial [Rubrobacteraceae bacterium]|nr:topoisomerase C-terminal repeat-containing protein [Rubrobacteraceae bacterium]
DNPLASPEMTALWEKRLARMERGEERRAGFMDDIGSFAAELVDQVRVMEGEKLAAPERTSREPLGSCPKCGSPVVETKKSYGCSAWKGGCKFAIWKTVAGKRISEPQAKQLLDKGKTGQLKGFKSKAGKPFAAALALDDEQKVKLDFDKEREPWIRFVRSERPQ